MAKRRREFAKAAQRHEEDRQRQAKSLEATLHRLREQGNGDGGNRRRDRNRDRGGNPAK